MLDALGHVVSVSKTCFQRALIFVLPVPAFLFAGGVGGLMVDWDPSWIKYPGCLLYLVISVVGFVHYALVARICVTGNEVRWHDWFGVKSQSVPLDLITAISEEVREAGYVFRSAVRLHWQGGHIDLNPNTFRKSTIRALIAELQRHRPDVDVDPRVHDLLTGTDYWVSR